MGRYDDIINMPHPTSSIYPRMSRQNRAAQFSPFAALTGYNESIEETAADCTSHVLEQEHSSFDKKFFSDAEEESWE